MTYTCVCGHSSVAHHVTGTGGCSRCKCELTRANVCTLAIATRKPAAAPAR